jgi:hypothetical protein
LSTLETVWCDTPAAVAASAITGGRRLAGIPTATPLVPLEMTVSANNRSVKAALYYGLVTPKRVRNDCPLVTATLSASIDREIVSDNCQGQTVIVVADGGD